MAYAGYRISAISNFVQGVTTIHGEDEEEQEDADGHKPSSKRPSKLQFPIEEEHEETGQTTSHDESSVSTHLRSSISTNVKTSKRSSVCFASQVTEADGQTEPSPPGVHEVASRQRAQRGSGKEYELIAAAKKRESTENSGSKRRSSAKERSSIKQPAGVKQMTMSVLQEKYNSSNSSCSQGGNLPRRSAQVMKTWSLKQKNALIPDAMKLYSLPGQKISHDSCQDPHGGTLRGAKDSVDHSDVGTGHDEHARKRRMSLSHVRIEKKGHKYKFRSHGDDDLGFEAVGPGADRTDLSVYEASEILADANVSIAAVRDVLRRFEGKDPKKKFTSEYLASQHLYGTMTDYLRELWVSTVRLGEDVAMDLDDGGSALNPHHKDTLDGFARSRGAKLENSEAEMQREKLARWLKMVLDSLNELNWEHLRLDFAKWVKTTHDSDSVLRDNLEHIGEHMDEALNLLTISRYAIEEALGSHLVIAADALTQFYEEMKTWNDQDLRRRGPRQQRGNVFANNMLQGIRLQQLLAIAQDEKERQRRNLEMNDGLYRKMLQAMGSDAPLTDNAHSKDVRDRPGTPGKFGRTEQGEKAAAAKSEKKGMFGMQALMVNKAVDKFAKKADKTIIIGGPGGEGLQPAVKSHVEVMNTKKARPHSHIEAMFMRSIQRARECLDAINIAVKDREEHLRHVVLQQKYAAKAQRRAARKARYSLNAFGSAVEEETGQESEPKIEVQITSLLIPDEGAQPQELDWSDVEVQWLVKKRSELAERLNSATVPVSLAGVWGKRRFRAEQDRMRLVDRAGGGARRGGVGRRVSNTNAKLPGALPLSASSSRRPSQTLGPASRRESFARRESFSRRESFTDQGRRSSNAQDLKSGRPLSARKGLRKATTLFLNSGHTSSCSDLADVAEGDFNSTSSRRDSKSLSDKGSRRASNADFAPVDEGFSGAREDTHCLDRLLKTLVELEGKEMSKQRKFADICKSNKRLVAKAKRRWLADTWDYDDQEFQVWFKKNPREPMVEAFTKEVNNALASGTLLLGRKGECDLKELQAELRSLHHSLTMEHEERVRCCGAKIPFDEAAWHFRTQYPLQQIMKKFGPVWGALKERIGFGSKLMLTDKDATEAANTQEEDLDGADKLFQQHMALQTNLLKVEHDAFIRSDLVNTVKSEADRMATRRDRMKAFCEKFVHLEELRTEVGGMKLTYRDLQKKLVDTMQELRFITMGIGRSNNPSGRKLELGMDAANDPHNSEQNLKPGDKHAFAQSASALAAQELLKHLHEKFHGIHNVHSFATPLFRSVNGKRLKKKGKQKKGMGGHDAAMLMNHEKLMEMMEQMDKAGNILKVRVERKKEDMKRLIDKLTKGNRSLVPMSKEELQAKWDKDISDMRSKLANLMKMKQFWQERLAHWYEEVCGHYGGDVQTALQDETRHNHKDGNIVLMHALSNQIAKERHSVPQHTLGTMHGKSLGRGQAVKSLVFEQAMQTLSEIDSIRQVTSDLRRSAALMNVAESRLTDLPSEMKAKIHKLQSTLDSEGGKVALPALPSVFGKGGRNRKSGNLYRSSLGRSLKRGTSIRDRVMQLFLKANIQNGLTQMSGEDSLGHGGPAPGLKNMKALQARRRKAGRSARLKEMNPLSVAGFNRSMDLMEEQNKMKQQEKEEQPKEEPSKKPVRRLSVTFRTQNEPEDGIYDDDGSDAESEISDKARRQKSNRQSSGKNSRPTSAGSNRSDRSNVSGRSRHSVSSSTYSKTRRKREDGESMDENIGILKDRAERLERRRRRRRDTKDTDPGTARVHMLRLFMDDAEAGEEAKAKKKATRFKQRASVIVENSPKSARRNTQCLLKEIAGRRSAPGDGNYNVVRRSDRRQFLAEEKRRHTVNADISAIGLVGTNAVSGGQASPRAKNRRRTKSMDAGHSDICKSDIADSEEDRSQSNFAKMRRRTLCTSSAASYQLGDDDDEDEGTSDSNNGSGSSSSSRKLSDLDQVLADLEEQSPEQEQKSTEIYSPGPSVPQLGLRLLRNCRDRMLQECTSFEKAYDRAAAHGAQKRKGRHRSSNFIKQRNSTKQELLDAGGFIWLAARLGYGEDDARAIFDHLTFAAGAETVSTEVITEGDEEHGPSVTRDGFVEALRTAMPLSSMFQLRSRLQQRYGRLDALFDLTSDGSGEMALATFCTLCESVGAIVKEATPLFEQMELNNEIPPDYVGGTSQVTKRAFLLTLRHAEALAAARRLAKRLTTMSQLMKKEIVDEKSEAEDLSAAGIAAKRGSEVKFAGDSEEGAEAASEQAPAAPAEESIEEGHSIQSTEKMASLYYLFMNTVDKRYHAMPLTMDAMRAAVKTFIPFKEDVHLIFRLAQKNTHSAGKRARVQDFVLRALGGFGHRCKVLAEAVGHNMSAQNAASRCGQLYNAAAARVEGARSAARQAKARRRSRGHAGMDDNMLEVVADSLAIAGGSSIGSDESGAAADESATGDSCGSGDLRTFKDRDYCKASAQLRSVVPRRGLAALASKPEKPRKRLEERHMRKPATPARRLVGAEPTIKAEAETDAAKDDEELQDENPEEDETWVQEASEEEEMMQPLRSQRHQTLAMRKKSVIMAERVSFMSMSSAGQRGSAGSIADLDSRRNTIVDLANERASAEKPSETSRPTTQAMRKRSIVGGGRPTMPSLDEDEQARSTNPAMRWLRRSRMGAGTEDQEGKSPRSRLLARRESGAGVLLELSGGEAGAQGEDAHAKRAARPGAVRRQQVQQQAKRRQSNVGGSHVEDPAPSTSPEGLAKRRLRHGMAGDASGLLVSAKEELEDGDLWKWKDDPTARRQRLASLGDMLGKPSRERNNSISSEPEDAEASLAGQVAKPESALSLEGVQPEEAASTSAAVADDAEGGEVISAAIQELESTAKQISLQRQAIEQLEADRHRKRLHLFDGNEMELQIATQRLQDCRVKFLIRFRSPGKAFEVLVGSREAKIPIAMLQTKIEKVLSFNPLDAQRVVTVLTAVEEVQDLGYNKFLNAMRFATPVHSILEFRTRLVQRYCQVECALRVLGFTENVELDVGLFDRPMIGAGILSSDARRIFRVADTAQPGGPRGYLSVAGLRFALDHAHVLAWLEAFYVKVAAAKGRSAQSVHDAIVGAGRREEAHNDAGVVCCLEDEPIETAERLQMVLGSLEFPTEFARDTFAFLQRRGPQVTLIGLAHVVHHAFGSEARRDVSKRGAAQPQQKVNPRQQGQGASKWGGLMGTAGVKANTQSRGLAEIAVMAKTAHQLPATAPGGAAAPTEGAAGNPSPAAKVVTDDMREEALVQTRRLRQHVIAHFANYQEAYHVFKRQSPLDGISLDEWMEAMEGFSFSDPAGWEQIFGHIIDWKHMRWDIRYRGAEGRVTLAGLANALDHAAPCTTPIALRKLLQEKYFSMQKAWVQLSGREGVEELSVSVWQQAMHRIAVVAEDAGHLHAVLRAAPIAERAPDNQNLNLSRVAFMSTMRSPEAVARLFDLLLRCSSAGPVSCAFEAHVFRHEPLPISAFEEQLGEMMAGTEAKLLFSFLDANQEGVVSICDLLDALTIMQAAYLPYAPPVASHTAVQQHREAVTDAAADASTPLPVFQSRDNASATPTSAPISPSDIKGQGSRMFDSPYDEHLQTASTALPDSALTYGSEDDSETESPSRQQVQRPWTSMSVVGSAGQASGSTAQPDTRTGGSALGFTGGASASIRASTISSRKSVEAQGAFTHAPFLPSLDRDIRRTSQTWLSQKAEQEDPPRGWEQVAPGNPNSSATDQQGFATGPVRDIAGAELSGDLMNYVEDRLGAPVHADHERAATVPRPRSDLAPPSSKLDRRFTAGLPAPAETSANLPRPRSELGASSSREATLALSMTVSRHGGRMPATGKGQIATTGRAQTPNPLEVALVGRSRTPNPLEVAVTGRAQTPNPLEVARASAAAARGPRNVRPASELGMARRASPPAVVPDLLPQPVGARGEAQQAGRSPLPALGGNSQQARSARGVGGKRDGGGMGNLSGRR